jgi:hypothetical protein
MNKKPPEPDEMRMPAAEFDEMMRGALGAPIPDRGNRKLPPATSEQDIKVTRPTLPRKRTKGRS